MPPVTVRVWSDKKINRLGHVSLETSKHYISFWRDDTQYDKFQEKPEKLFVKRIPGKGCLTTYHHDRWRTTYGEPIHEVTLETLSAAEIDRQFEAFMAQDFEWNLLNGFFKSFSRKYPQDMTDRKSCSGLIASLLYAGGIERLLPVRTRLLKGCAAGIVGSLFYVSVEIAKSKFQTDEQMSSTERPLLDGDSTMTSGLAITALTSTGFLMMLERMLSKHSLSHSTYVIMGAAFGLACGFLRITDKGPPLPIRDIGRMICVAKEEEKKSLQIAPENHMRECSRRPQL